MPKKIDPAVKERAMRMVADHRQDYPSETALAAAVAQQGRCRAGDGAPLGGPGRGRRRRPARDDHRRAGRDQAAEGGEPAAARGQRDPPRGNGFLRRGARPPQPLIMAFIDDMRAEGHAVESTCRVLREQGCQVAARTYRAWKPGRPPDRDPDRDRRGRHRRAARAIQGTPKGLYGRRKMTHYLRRQGCRWRSAPSIA